MQTRTRRGLALLLALALVAGGVAWFVRRQQASAPPERAEALDAIPNGALLVAAFDLPALRASPVGAPLLREEREIPGLGKVRDVCGFDPLAALGEVVVAVPAAGDSGDFGLAAAGSMQDELLLACASKVISSRGGQAVVTPLGSFRAVRDASAPGGSGEIAVRPGGPILLGGGAYLRDMVDTADGRTPSVRASAAHAALARELGPSAARVTVVLTPDQRKQLAEELAQSGAQSSPAASILAAGAGVALGPEVVVRGVLACAGSAPCAELATQLRAARDARANDLTMRLAGLGSALDRLTIEAEGATLRLRLTLPAGEASALVDRLLALRSLRRAAPEPTSPRPGPTAAPRP